MSNGSDPWIINRELASQIYLIFIDYSLPRSAKDVHGGLRETITR